MHYDKINQGHYLVKTFYDQIKYTLKRFQVAYNFAMNSTDPFAATTE
jgi:hypothetical protein